MSSDLQRISRAMCSIDLADSQWIQELPELPVPDLWLTVSRYLASLKAVLAPQQEAGERPIGCQLSDDELLANRRQFERTEQLVKQFMLNEGPQLQRDLIERTHTHLNWATDKWLEDMYLRNPLPLPVNSNPFFLFPRQQFASSHEMLMFATRIIQFSVDFKYRIDQQTLRQDYGSGHGRGKPLCMATYKNFFHSYRMPHEVKDELLPQSRRSNHIVVASCNQFYILRLGQDPLPDPYRKDAAGQLNESSILDQLLRIYRVSRERARRKLVQGTGSELAPPVGLFTTENRKTWARLHKRLSHCGTRSLDQQQPGTINSESLRQIEDCLFVMCLDSLIDDESANNKGTQSSNEAVEAASLILAGGGSRKFTANRWFDKFLQIIVGRDGVCGINIEHSASEGITVLRFLEEFMQFLEIHPMPSATSNGNHKLDQQPEIRRSSNGHGPLMGTDSITAPGYVEPESPSLLLEHEDKIVPLKWELDSELECALEEAASRVDKLVNSFSLQILEFTHFGRDFITSQNLSPDAFVQLALQYTFYKLHGQLVSTYESASLRQFRLGRVDNIRANTCEAFDWIQAMLKCSGDRFSAEAHKRFTVAISKQVEILRYTITGGGPDNHLLVLRELAPKRYDDELPELFNDPSYRGTFLNFRLSTSQLPTKFGITVGYGAVVPDGYGCSYNPCASKIVFCISSFIDCPATSSFKFAETLEQSLLEMRQLCQERATPK